jgi:L,D-transpeptidase YcbB
MRPVYGVVLTLWLAGPLSTPTKAAEPDATEALINRAEAVRIAVQNQLSGKFSDTTEHEQNDTGALVEYYSEHALLWVDEKGLTNRGKSMVAEVRKADDYGLRASDYDLPNVASLGAQGTNVIEALADAEIKISYALLDYTHDARGGRIEPAQLSPNLDPTLALPDPLEVIESIAYRADPAAYLRSFQPAHPRFEMLRDKLIELRGGGDNAERPEVTIPDGPLLKFGVVDPQVALLRTRLEVSAGQNPHLFDDAVLKAVRKFQLEHNTSLDGVVGPSTRRHVNQPHLRNVGRPSQIEAVLLNMERWRWLPHDLGAFYVIVNVPEFTLRVVKDDETIHTARVVVGEADKQTPVFSDEMRTVVFNPYWNVPNSIKTEEIRPYIGPESSWFGVGRWNTSVLQRHNLRIKYGGREVDPESIDWSRVDIRNLHLYQPPGPGNVLGKVKFLFPNKHAVYMHDTPQKHLFGQQVRAESHGCMRVQDPDRLAAILLGHDQGWSSGAVASAFQASDNRHVALQSVIPVYVTYFTLRVNDDGSIASFSDLYGHDSRMSTALFGAADGQLGSVRDLEQRNGNRVQQASTRRDGIANGFAGPLAN